MKPGARGEKRMSETHVRVGRADEIAAGEVRIFEVGEERVAVCRVGDAFYAVDDVCTHDDGPLGAGSIQDHQIECPRHGARFDVRTGDAVRMPAVAPVRTYPVEVRDGDLYVGKEPLE
ncbi:MAG: Rieske 2Fe-2S domain-containing protein [Candidatus Eisenbacteria bacterium]|nr:Rieske 2Fe-2S domain-containing protein [Candidatus Eisenbacteria bacterium]